MRDLDTEIKTAAELLTALQAEKKERRRREHEERRETERKERNAFAERLAAEYLSAMPQTLTDRVFDYAWREGHSNGSVQYVYGEVAEIVAEAWEEAQKR